VHASTSAGRSEPVPLLISCTEADLAHSDRWQPEFRRTSTRDRIGMVNYRGSTGYGRDGVTRSSGTSAPELGRNGACRICRARDPDGSGGDRGLLVGAT